VTTYTDLTDWQTAAGSSVTEPFNSSGLQLFTDVTTVNGAIGPARGLLSGSVWTDLVTDTASTTFSFLPGPIFAAGAVWNTSPLGEGSGLLITLNLEGGGTQKVGFIGPIDDAFFGWTSSVPFDSFTITNALPGFAETFDMDNLDFATATPEPTSMCWSGVVC
jgi:hypothetical protein